MKITGFSNVLKSYKTLRAARDLHSAARTPPEYQESVLQNTSFAYGARASGRRFPGPGGTGFRDMRNEKNRLAYSERDATYRLTNSFNIYLMWLNPKKPCVPRETTFRLTNSCHIYSLCFSPINLMCRERLAFGGTHPPEFQESVLQSTSFPFGVRA